MSNTASVYRLAAALAIAYPLQAALCAPVRGGCLGKCFFDQLTLRRRIELFAHDLARRGSGQVRELLPKLEPSLFGLRAKRCLRPRQVLIGL
jgi:hypothetical protein